MIDMGKERPRELATIKVGSKTHDVLKSFSPHLYQAMFLAVATDIINKFPVDISVSDLTDEVLGIASLTPNVEKSVSVT